MGKVSKRKKEKKKGKEKIKLPKKKRIRVEKGKTKTNMGWHMDRKENPSNGIHPRWCIGGC